MVQAEHFLQQVMEIMGEPAIKLDAPAEVEEYYGITLYEQLERLASNMTGEIIRGTLYVQPRPAPPHLIVASELGYDLIGPFQRGRGGPGGWWILDEPEIHFEEKVEVVAPDLAGWKKERLPHMPETAYFLTIPDWICEILSPNNEEKDREKKYQLYEKYQVSYYWIIDPIKQTLEAFSLNAGRYEPAGSYERNEKAKIVPFHAITLDLKGLWIR